MFNRRVVIFSRQDDKYATCGSLCGMAKFSLQEEGTQVSVFVSNLQAQEASEWWAIALVEGKAYASKLTHFNNYTFTIASKQLENVGFMLVCRSSTVQIVAENYLGNRQVNNVDRGKIASLIGADTAYESFVGATDNFYPKDTGVDVAKLRRQSAQKYVALQNYSSAFERYYATGRGDNYLLSVQTELEQLFDKFPPYYPLINKYEQSYFVRVDFPNCDKYFVVGVIAHNKQVRYICYALPGQRDGLDDKDFSFVEKDGQGFWMLCQDAENGQITTLQQ